MTAREPSEVEPAFPIIGIHVETGAFDGYASEADAISDGMVPVNWRLALAAPALRDALAYMADKCDDPGLAAIADAALRTLGGGQ